MSEFTEEQYRDHEREMDERDLRRETEFTEELQSLLNRYGAEKASNTPDFILANYVKQCLVIFAEASNAREKWYGKELRPGR